MVFLSYLYPRMILENISLPPLCISYRIKLSMCRTAFCIPTWSLAIKVINLSA